MDSLVSSYPQCLELTENLINLIMSPSIYFFSFNIYFDNFNMTELTIVYKENSVNCLLYQNSQLLYRCLRCNPQLAYE